MSSVSKKKNKTLSILAVNSAKKKVNQFSREAERIQLSINKCEESIKTRSESVSTFAVERKQNDLEVLRLKYSRVMVKHDAAKSLYNSYLGMN
jgi:hypothetical protein